MKEIEGNSIDCDDCEESFMAGEPLCRHLRTKFYWGSQYRRPIPPQKRLVKAKLEGFESRQAIRDLKHKNRRAWYKTYKDKKPNK
jgi:hypothetical protein